MKNLTLAQVAAKVQYNPNTGVFINKRTKKPLRSRTTSGAIIKINQTRFSAAKVAWFLITGELPTGPILHLNHDNFDCRKINLVCKQTLKISKIHKQVTYNKESGLFTSKVYLRTHKPGDTLGFLTSNGYLSISIDNRDVLLSRLAWFMTYNYWPEEIDHINRIKTDNRFVNLREANSVTQSLNRNLSKRNISGKTGVTWHKATNKWVVHLRVRGYLYYGGLFIHKQDAIKKRLQLETLYNYHYSS